MRSDMCEVQDRQSVEAAEQAEREDLERRTVASVLLLRAPGEPTSLEVRLDVEPEAMREGLSQERLQAITADVADALGEALDEQFNGFHEPVATASTVTLNVGTVADVYEGLVA